METPDIRPATEADLPGILAIYNDLVQHSDAVYTEQPVTIAERRTWLQGRLKEGFPVLVAQRQGEVLGVASFAPFRPAWPGYRHTVEHSVHVRREHYRQGIGSALLQALLVQARERGLHAMIGVVDAANQASLRLHARHGFRVCGRLPQVGRKFGRWLDVVLVECLLDDLASQGSGLPVAAEADAFVTRSHLVPDGEIHLKSWPAARQAVQGPAGAGRPAVLLLHGLFGDVDVWAATALNLRRAGLDVMAVDLPGHGASRAGACSLQAVADCIAEVLQAERLSRVLLVGHSFGALVAARLARQLPAHTAGLVLIAPAGMGREVNGYFLQEMLEAADGPALAEGLARLTVKRYRVSPGYLRHMQARIAAVRPQLQQLIDDVVGEDGMQQASILEILDAIECPLAIVQGREDAIMPWGHALNAPPHAALHLLPAVGHMPHWEANALTSRIILQTAALAAGY